MSFFCAHLDQPTEQCLKLKVECVPGRRGCVLRGKVTFLEDPDKRVAARDPVKKRPVRPAKANASAKAVGLILALLAGALRGEAQTELDALLAPEDPVWTLSADDFTAKFAPLGFRWTSETRDTARAGDELFNLWGLPVYEALVRFGPTGPRHLAFSVFNRGDAGDLDKPAFTSLLSRAYAQATAWAGGAKPTPVGEQMNLDGIRRQAVEWVRPPSRLRLLWSYSTKDAQGSFAYRAEYIRLESVPVATSPAGVAPGRPGAAKPAALSASGLRSRVRKAAGGDVVLDRVPMVDQGQKGYCVVAAAERVLRYYAVEVDQHELAQLSASSAEEGTDPRKMMDGLKRVGTRLGLRIKVLEDFDFDDFLKLVDRYNSAAKRVKLPPLTYGHVVDVGALYEAMDPAVLREVRLKQQGDFGRFKADVTGYTDRGFPLLWSVHLGKVPETPALPQAGGGHMRLIIGYNPAQGEVLYSDSWGQGHELKRMKWEDAWTITGGLYLVEPRNLAL